MTAVRSAARQHALCALYFPHKIKDQQNHQNESDPPVKTMTYAIASGGNAADQNQHENNKKDSSESHDGGSWLE